MSPPTAFLSTRLDNMNDKRMDKHKATMFNKRSMLAAATTAFGEVKDWRLEDLKSARSLVTMLKPKDLQKLDTGVVSTFLVEIKVVKFLVS